MSNTPAWLSALAVNIDRLVQLETSRKRFERMLRIWGWGATRAAGWCEPLSHNVRDYLIAKSKLEGSLWFLPDRELEPAEKHVVLAAIYNHICGQAGRRPLTSGGVGLGDRGRNGFGLLLLERDVPNIVHDTYKDRLERYFDDVRSDIAGDIPAVTPILIAKFTALAERFRRLRHDPVTDVLGTEANRTLEAQAARLYRAHAESGRAGFHFDLSEAYANDAPTQIHETLWTAAWSRVSMELATRPEYQTRLPSSFRLHGRVMPPLPNEEAYGSALSALGIPFENWRQRAEDNATICEILAELAGEHTPQLIVNGEDWRDRPFDSSCTTPFAGDREQVIEAVRKAIADWDGKNWDAVYVTLMGKLPGASLGDWTVHRVQQYFAIWQIDIIKRIGGTAHTASNSIVAVDFSETKYGNSLTTDTPDHEGCVTSPNDPAVYSPSGTLNWSVGPMRAEIGRTHRLAWLKNFTQNRVRWTRVNSRGKRDANGLFVHAADFNAALKRSEDEGKENDPSPALIAKRKQQHAPRGNTR